MVLNTTIMKDLFTQIQDKLQELTIGSATATAEAFLRHTDEDTGQLDSYERRPPVAFPCALITVQDLSANDIDTFGKTQQRVAQITIRLAWDFTGLTTDKTSAAHRAASLAYYDQLEKVYDLLQGFVPVVALTHLSNRGSRTERRPDRYKVLNQLYQCEYRR